jgi:hypothetical protein
MNASKTNYCNETFGIIVIIILLMVTSFLVGKQIGIVQTEHENIEKIQNFLDFSTNNECNIPHIIHVNGEKTYLIQEECK